MINTADSITTEIFLPAQAYIFTKSTTLVFLLGKGDKTLVQFYFKLPFESNIFCKVQPGACILQQTDSAYLCKSPSKCFIRSLNLSARFIGKDTPT